MIKHTACRDDLFRSNHISRGTFERLNSKQGRTVGPEHERLRCVITSHTHNARAASSRKQAPSRKTLPGTSKSQYKARFERTPMSRGCDRPATPIAEEANGGDTQGDTFSWKKASSGVPATPPAAAAPHTSPSSANDDDMACPRLLPMRLPHATELPGVTDMLSVMYVSAIFLAMRRDSSSSSNSSEELPSELSPPRRPLLPRLASLLRASFAFFLSAFSSARRRLDRASMPPLAPSRKLRELASMASESWSPLLSLSLSLLGEDEATASSDEDESSASALVPRPGLPFAGVRVLEDFFLRRRCRRDASSSWACHGNAAVHLGKNSSIFTILVAMSPGGK